MKNEEQARALGQPSERHLAHERRRAVKAQEQDGVRRTPLAAQEIRQLEVDARLLQACVVPPRREVLLERRRRPPEQRPQELGAAPGGAAEAAVVFEGGEEDEDVLCDLRRVLAAEFGHCLANPSEARSSVLASAPSSERRKKNAAFYLEQRVYQRLLLLCAAVALALQTCEERLACFLCEKRDDQAAQPFSDRAVLVFHGVVWGYYLVAKDAEGDLGVQFEVLDQRSLHDRNFPWFIWQQGKAKTERSP